MDVAITRKSGLCVSCEICVAVCPEGAITMELDLGQFLPKIDRYKCTDCGACFGACPGLNIGSQTLDRGSYLESFTAHSNDLSIRQKASSGGIVTTLVAKLLEDKKFGPAFVLPFNTFVGDPVRLQAVDSPEEALASAKSKYLPASVYNVVRFLIEQPNLKCIIVATPCQILGIKAVIERYHIPETNILFLGLFCDRTLNLHILRYFEDTYKERDEKLVKFEYRTKEDSGWPGDSKLYFDSGRERVVDRRVRASLKPYFQLMRCLFCTDKLNRLADISIGDCYIDGKSSYYGNSSVIVRTKKGKDILDRYSNLFTLEPEGIETISRSQALETRRDHIRYIGFLRGLSFSKETAKILRGLTRHIKWGQEYRLDRIKLDLLLSRVSNYFRSVERAFVAGTKIIEGILFRESNSLSRRKNIMIVGAGLSNKGSQAMLFATVDELKEKFPDKCIYLLSTQDFEREEEETLYTFGILPWQGLQLDLLGHPAGSPIVNRVRKITRDAFAFIDISGYALSSTAPCYNSVGYLVNILVARKYSVPYYILPQSVGPFDYKWGCKSILYPFMKFCLRYPKKILVREEAGIKALHGFTDKVEKSHDIVLLHKEYNLTNIYKKEISLKTVEIEQNSVGVIPNYQLTLRTDPDKIYSLYYSLVKELLASNKMVYIFRYAYNDLTLCEIIKGFFPNESRVKFLSDDFNCLELEDLIRQMDFVVASRYHSVVQAYKVGTPALVLSWADKYSELTEHFSQSRYLVDITEIGNIEETTEKLHGLIQNWTKEGTVIASKLREFPSVSLGGIDFR